MKTKPGVVALLLEAGADPDVVNNQSKTPLDLAISGAKDEIIDLLLEAGAAVEPPADGMQLAVALLIISFVLMFFEVLLPGMVLGACAVLSLFASVAVAYSNTDHGNIFLIIALVSLAVFAVGFVYWFPKSYMGRNLTSNSAVGDLGIDLSELINKTGSAYTNLRPSGTAVIGDDRVDVVTEGTFVEKDRPVKVVAVEGQRVVVREVEFLT
jgi:membrane-bound ClpP family serine protease